MLRKRNSNVSFEGESSEDEATVEDDAFEDDEDSKRSVKEDETPAMGARRARRASVFSMEDFITKRRERANTLQLKGDFVTTHCDKPSKITETEDSLGYFEVRKTSRVYTFSRSFSIGSTDTAKSLHRLKSIVSLQGDDVSTSTNTFQLGPFKQFSVPKVKSIMVEEFDKAKHLANANSKVICLELANSIKKRVKLLGFNRYKYIVLVTLGQNKQQDVRVASNCFWDATNDMYVTHTTEMENMFVVGTVYACYCL